MATSLKPVMLLIAGGFVGSVAVYWLDGVDPDTGSRSGTGSESGQSAPSGLLTPVVSPQSGQVMTLEQLAAEDPAAALDQVLQIADAFEQRLAAERIAALWVAEDPLAALAAADRLPPSLRTAFRAAIDGNWARLDARSYLAYIEENPQYLEELTGRGHYDAEPILESSDGIRLLLANDPLGVLNLADKLSSRIGTTLKAIAISAYAEKDPFAALALIEQMPVAQERDQARDAFATGYANADPEGALAWAHGLAPPPASTIGNILNVIAQTDVRRAVDLAVQTPWSGHFQFPPINAIVLQAGEDSFQAAIAGDALLASNAPSKDYRLGILLQTWAGHDPESVINWLSTNSAALGADAIAGPAVVLGSRDPALAASFTDQIPFNLRSAWIDRVAQGYAQVDSAGAMDWISRYQGQEGYDIGLRRVLAYYSGDDPPAAARVVESASTEIQLGAAGTVADRWARQDGKAAAEWARGLTDDNVRAIAFEEAVGAWMSQSSQSAEDWTLSLPRGADRDQALYVLVRGRFYTTQPRESYSTNPTETLVAQIGNPAMRREVEAWFEE